MGNLFDFDENIIGVSELITISLLISDIINSCINLKESI